MNPGPEINFIKAAGKRSRAYFTGSNRNGKPFLWKVRICSYEKREDSAGEFMNDRKPQEEAF